MNEAIVNVVRDCQRCKSKTTQSVKKNISGSQAEQCAWMCAACGSWTDKKGGGLWIPKEDLRAQGCDLDEIPIGKDGAKHVRCSRCGARGGELHHWAPRSMFDDAEEWPTDTLCIPCHDKWHDIVTPSISKNHRDRGESFRDRHPAKHLAGVKDALRRYSEKANAT